VISDWFRRHSVAATLKSIYIAPAAGADMQSVNSVKAISDRGLEGDRYCDDNGHWKSIDGCQVTLTCEYDIKQSIKGVSATIHESIINGGHRRNLVIDGFKVSALEGKTFEIGDAIFIYEKNRPPCAYIDQIAGQGMCKALGHHSGICIKVVKSGDIAVGDAINIIEV